jgi:VanZ family protein
MSRGNKIAFQIIFWLYVAGVFFLCFGHFDNTPSIPTSVLGIPTDKIAHFTMFFPFPILAFFAFDRFTETVKSTPLFVGITFIVGFLLAFATEWGQAHLTEYRSGDSFDFLADSLALFLSSVLVAWVDIRKQRRGNHSTLSSQ